MISRVALLAASFLLGPGDGTVLAPGPGQAARPGAAADASGPAEAIVEEASWKLCEVTASILVTAPGRSMVAQERRAHLYLGEDLDLSGDVTVPMPQGAALVHARARLRAAAATTAGVTYFVASEGVLRSTVGFQHAAAGVDQFRNEVVEVTDQGTRLHEIFALPDAGLRVVLVFSARPVTGPEERTVLQMLRAPAVGDARRFLVEAFLREGETYQPLEQSTLATMDGRRAGLSLTRFSGAAGGRGLQAPSVEMIVVPGGPERRAADMGGTRGIAADRKFQDRVDALQRSLKIDPTIDIAKKLPGQRDLPGTPRKISEAKKKKILEAQKRQAIREWAIEQAKKLPASETEAGAAAADAEAASAPEELTISVTPLRLAQGSLQLEIGLRGRVRLPREEALTPIDATLVEQVRFGESIELGIAELVREGEPLYDYVLRITPSEP